MLVLYLICLNNINNNNQCSDLIQLNKLQCCQRNQFKTLDMKITRTQYLAIILQFSNLKSIKYLQYKPRDTLLFIMYLIQTWWRLLRYLLCKHHLNMNLSKLLQILMGHLMEHLMLINVKLKLNQSWSRNHQLKECRQWLKHQIKESHHLQR